MKGGAIKSYGKAIPGIVASYAKGLYLEEGIRQGMERK